jgi:hypothetical protein
MDKIKREFIVYVDSGSMIFRTELEISQGDSGLDDAYELVDTYLNDKRVDFSDFDLIEVDTVERVSIT